MERPPESARLRVAPCTDRGCTGGKLLPALSGSVGSLGVRRDGHDALTTLWPFCRWSENLGASWGSEYNRIICSISRPATERTLRLTRVLAPVLWILSPNDTDLGCHDLGHGN